MRSCNNRKWGRMRVREGAVGGEGEVIVVGRGAVEGGGGEI